MTAHTCRECAFFKPEKDDCGFCPVYDSIIAIEGDVIDGNASACPAFRSRDREDAVKRLAEAAKVLVAAANTYIGVGDDKRVSIAAWAEQHFAIVEAIAAVEEAVKEVEK